MSGIKRGWTEAYCSYKEIREDKEMEKNLLIVGSKDYGECVKEIAEKMGEFDKISFLDDSRADSVGKMEDLYDLRSEYKYAIAACESGEERVALNQKLEEALFIVPFLMHPDSCVSPSSNLMKGSIVEPGAVIGAQVSIGVGTIVGANCVVEQHCFIGDGSLLRAGTIVRKNSYIPMGTVTDYGTVLLIPLTDKQ